MPSSQPMQPELAQLDRFRATFRPQRTDDLKPGVADYIGQRFIWQASGFIEDGFAYAGDWHCILEPDQVPTATFIWAPLCDLEDVELLD